jgi:hypothetical protein
MKKGIPGAGGESKMPQIKVTIADLQTMMDEEFETLKSKWAEYERAKEELDRLNGLLSNVVAKETDRLKLNVGGMRFEIRLSCVMSNVFFKSLASGTFADADRDGFFYIDRDPMYMPVIMSHFRKTVDLTEFSDADIDGIREEADFYMVQDLVDDIDAHRLKKLSAEGILISGINKQRPVSHAFNGVFFEINVIKKDFKLHSISFVAGESRKIVGEAYYKEGGIDSPGQPVKICVVETMATKGSLVTIQFSAIPLALGTHTIGVYSVSSPGAVAVCPRAESSRQFNGFTLEKSYHTTNSKGYITSRTGENDYDFCGEVAVSF